MLFITPINSNELMLETVLLTYKKSVMLRPLSLLGYVMGDKSFERIDFHITFTSYVQYVVGR